MAPDQDIRTRIATLVSDLEKPENKAGTNLEKTFFENWIGDCDELARELQSEEQFKNAGDEILKLLEGLKRTDGAGIRKVKNQFNAILKHMPEAKATPAKPHEKAPIPSLGTAYGAIASLDDDSLTLNVAGANGENTPLVLNLTTTRHTCTLFTKKPDGKLVLRPTKKNVKSLPATQNIAVIYYTVKKGELVLLQAVVEQPTEK